VSVLAQAGTQAGELINIDWYFDIDLSASFFFGGYILLILCVYAISKKYLKTKRKKAFLI
jgi:hypothetical protein